MRLGEGGGVCEEERKWAEVLEGDGRMVFEVLRAVARRVEVVCPRGNGHTMEVRGVQYDSTARSANIRTMYDLLKGHRARGG